MSTQTTIPGTDDAWESGQLGADDAFVGHLTAEEIAADAALIQGSLGLQPISIRLEKTLIESFKTIATIEGLGYQTLMRQALKRSADCEMRRILVNVAADLQQARATAPKSKPDPKKAAKAA